jgi:hypothetical protein
MTLARLDDVLLHEHPAVALEVLDAVLALRPILFELGEDLRAAALRGREVRIDVVDEDGDAVDDPLRLAQTCA